jgi:hypothetical protein
MGGENQQDSLNRFSGYSKSAHCIGMPSYLEPNSGSMHVPIEGVYRATEKTEDRVAIGEKHNQNHAENTAQTYLEPIRNRMQKPIEGLLVPIFGAINKGGGLSRRATEQPFIQQPESTKNCTPHSTATRGNRKDPIYESLTLEKVNINPQVKG